MRHCYLSLCMCEEWPAGWKANQSQTSCHPYRVTNTSVTKIQHFSPDDGHVEARNIFYSVALVRERTIPTERPPQPVGEVSANFCG